MICAPAAHLSTCNVIEQTTTYRQCAAARRRLGHPRAQCRRIPIDTN